MLSQPIPSSPAQCRQDITYTWGPDDGGWCLRSLTKVGDDTTLYLHLSANTLKWTMDILGLDGSPKWTVDTLGLNGPPELPVDTHGLNGPPEWPVDTFGLNRPLGWFPAMRK